MRIKTLLVALVCVGVVAGCYSPASYRGDGRLYDAGWISMYERFWLDLGQLPDAGPAEFRLQGLPGSELTLGLFVESLAQSEAEEQAERFGVAAELRLTAPDGQVVIDERGPLAEWVWTCGWSAPNVGGDCAHSSFAYLRGGSREVLLKGGNTRDERIGVKADGGWGTYFRPRRRREYRLEIRLRNGEAFTERYPVRVVASG